MSNIKTFFCGEVLMRLECPDHARFVQTEKFNLFYTGAELNSAVIMHQLGVDELYLITAVPDNALGEAALNSANHWGVNTNFSLKQTGRLGTFYLEQGFGPRPSRVIYDRSNSVFALSDYDDYRFEDILTDGAWLYISGTLPALTPEKILFTQKLLQTAKSKNCTVCLDLNYRAALWDWDLAARTFTGLLQYVDILSGSESLAESMFKLPAGELCSKFALRYAGLTRRLEPESTLNICSGVLYCADGSKYESKKFSCQMLDRIGGGDAFSGALLYSLQNNSALQKTIDFATAAMVLKQTVHGDFGLCSAGEIEDLLTNDNHIAVKR